LYQVKQKTSGFVPDVHGFFCVKFIVPEQGPEPGLQVWQHLWPRLVHF
jgi:hypothetical protein